MVNQLKALDENAQIARVRRRPGDFYMTTLATMVGLDIRVETEDTHWRSPLSDEMGPVTSRCSGGARWPSFSDARGRRPTSIAP
jgi:hypothetical protein